NLLIDCLSNPLMVGAQATGDIKWYQIIVGSLVFLNLPISYLILKLGYEPHSVYMVSITISLISLQFRLYFLKRVMNFNVKKYYFKVLSKAALLAGLSAVIIFLIKSYLRFELNFITLIIESAVLVGILVLMIILLGINK